MQHGILKICLGIYLSLLSILFFSREKYHNMNIIRKQYITEYNKPLLLLFYSNKLFSKRTKYYPLGAICKLELQR